MYIKMDAAPVSNRFYKVMSLVREPFPNPYRDKMVRLEGYDPPRFGLRVRRSAYWATIALYKMELVLSVIRNKMEPVPIN